MAFLKDVIADDAAVAQERRAVFGARLRSAAIIAYEFLPPRGRGKFPGLGRARERSLDFGSGGFFGDGTLSPWIGACASSIQPDQTVRSRRRITAVSWWNIPFSSSDP